MLQLKNICKKYVTGTLVQTALDDVSLNLRDNEFVAVLGPSGSGKTSLLNIIGGLDHYDSGDLIINGTSTKEYTDRDWDTYRNHTIGFVFQSYNLIPHQTILANVELALTISGISRGERRQRAKEALEKVGLGDQLHKRPNQLSGGQMQRVAIARALVNNPDILLADEPTGALDTQTGIQVMELLKEVASDRLVVMVTHNPDLAEQYATRIVRLTDGKLISDSDPFEVEEKKAKKGSYDKKSSMSILTALGLSANNLRTKKARTILTAFAGSIGIIGIGLILALSLGVNDYIKSIEQETLSEYPLTISSSGFDFTSLLSVTSGLSSSDEDEDSGDIRVISAVTSMFSSVNSNDLAALKTWLDSGESGIDAYARAIEYSYDVSPQIYRIVDDDTIRQVNPDSTFSSLGFGSSSSSSSLISSMMSTDVFFQLPEDESLYINQYDVVAGRWPESYNECVLVLSSGGSMSDFLLYSLGLRDSMELDDMVTSFINGENVDDIDDIGEYYYDDVLGISFKLVISADYYVYDEAYGVWTDMSGDADFLYDLVQNGEDMTIVGIVQPAEDATASSLSSGIYYPYMLTNYIVTEASSREIVQQQLADSSLNVLTGESFGTSSGLDIGQESLFSIDTDALSDLFSLDSDSIADLLSEMDFSDLDLSDLDFSDFDFSSLDLSDYDFSGLDLSSYDFSDLDLSSLDLSGLDLSSLDLSSLDLTDLDLSELDLSDFDLSALDLSSMDLSGFDLSALDLSSIDLSDMELDLSGMELDLSGLDLSGMDFSELIDFSSIDFASVLADTEMPEFDFSSMLENLSVNVSEETLSALFDELLAGYEDYVAEHPEADISQIGDAILAYLESDEAAAIFSEHLADLLMENGDITVSADAVEELITEILTGYLAYLEEMGYADDDIETMGTRFEEYFRTDEANEIVTAWAEEYLTFDTDIEISSDWMASLTEDLLAGYETYAEEYGYPGMSALTESFLDYLSSDTAQEIILDAVLSMVDMDALEAEITDLMQDYMQTYMEAVMDAVAAELEDALTEMLESQLTDALSGAISEALETQLLAAVSEALTESLSEAISEAIETQLTDALQSQLASAISESLEAQLSETLQTQLASAISESLGTQLTGALQSQLSAVLSDAMEEMMSELMENVMADLMSEVMGDLMSEVMSGMMDEVMSEVTSQLGTQISDVLSASMEDMLAGLSEEMLTSLTDAFSIDEETLSDVFSLNTTAEELYALLTSMSSSSTTADTNLTSFGYADLNSPSEIDIYSKDFESKGHVTDLLDAYNADLMAEGKEDQVITYTDLVGTLMSSVTDIVNIVTYVLIAFVSLSLVVSCIMIAIITHISVLERTKEIGILRAIGASKRNISEVFNAETFIIGLCSGMIGVGVSELLIIPINRLIQSLAGSDIVKAVLPVNYAVMLVLVSLFITIIGGLLPARSAAKKDPVIALRTE